MQVEDIRVGKLYRLVDGLSGEYNRRLVKIINIFFNEDWEEYCIQARPVGWSQFSQAPSFIASDFKEMVE